MGKATKKLMKEEHRYAIYVCRDNKRVLLPFTRELLCKIIDKQDMLSHMVMMYKTTIYPVTINLN